MTAAMMISLAALVAAPQGIFDDLAKEEARQQSSTPAAAETDSAAPTEAAGKADSAHPPPAVPASTPAVSTPALAAPSPKPVRSELRWRLAVAVGADHAQTSGLAWASATLPGTTHLRGERSLAGVVPGLSVYLGGEVWGRGTGQTEASLSFTSLEAAAGLVVNWPHDGLWGWLFPYGRAGLSAGYLRVRAGSSLGADLFVPGAQVAAGARLHFGRLHSGRRVSFYGFGEGGYALRLTRTVRLSPEGVDDEDDPALPGPAVRLGKVDLSGGAWRFGIGIAF